MVPAVELSEAMIATLIAAMGATAVVFAACRPPSIDRVALWFGLFASCYGVRLAGQSQLVQPLLPEMVWRSLDASITYAILVPAGLFIESLFGPGWRLLLRRTWQALAVYAVLAIAHDVIRRQPGSALWLNAPVVLTAGAIAMAHVLAQWRREQWTREFRVAVVGGVAFVAVAAYQTVGNATVEIEPFAMLVFMTSVGYFVAHRVLDGERRLAAVSRDLTLAGEIQQSILPRRLPAIDGLRVAACYLPMSHVGGDFYDFDTRSPTSLGVIVADVSGHGVPAALVASMVKIAFAAETARLDRPGVALTNINRTLFGQFTGAYVTAWCGSVDVLHGRLRYASAGHPAPLLRRRDGHVERLEQRGLLLAFETDVEYSTAEVDLRAGDRLLIFSDGLIEACNARDEFFGDARLEHLLSASAATTPQQFVDRLVGELRQWVGPDEPLQDDVTVVVVDVVHDTSPASGGGVAVPH